ncbi:GlyGly-CTERM sorting domain-containing protein [Photobacterium rosenbergii]|uniref:GlyGly-CTERM sorting domain-containing protein n=1 Tax=Photobacterium rosenbergii TaxID=294936 RepID=A0A2T3NFK0_9GAMM|nr:DUF3466 family protein [Photobacterium rosenbergii]PSW13356.1 GlyGly-CTERM sorting domain-containing protein [Photobacterium rosenbergii]
MQHKTLKLSALAVLVAGATGANAAVYRVVEVVPSTETQNAIDSRDYYNEVDKSELSRRLGFYGQGITASNVNEANPEDSDNCFKGINCNVNNYSVFGESRFGSDGINYRDEVPFILDNLQRINDVRRLENYCNSYLGPNTCQDWARTQFYGQGYDTNSLSNRIGFGGLVREYEAWTDNYFSNATAVVENLDQDNQADELNTLVEVSTFADDESTYSASSALGQIVDSEKHKTTNSVINGKGAVDLSEDGSGELTEYILGISSGAYFTDGSRNARQFNKRGFVNLVSSGNPEDKFALAPVEGDKLTETAGQSLAWDAVEYNGQLLVVGSASYDRSNFSDSDNKVPDDYNSGDPVFSDSAFRNCPTSFTEGLDSFYGTKECQLSVFANDGVFWSLKDGSSGNVAAKLLAENNLNTLDPDENDRSFQASARAIELVNNQPVVVGYTTDRYDNDYYAMRASVWELTGDINGETPPFTRKLIPGLELERSSDRVLTYTLATDINANNIVVGVAKNFRAENRSYAERMFVYDNNTGDNAQYLDSSKSNLFFTGSNGYPAAINNNNQIVGRLDAESVNQVNGRFRRQRGFTYIMEPIPGSNTLNEEEKAYFLDDLTNGGQYSDEANKYRIFEATGINDAGVISATAYKCEDGYDDFSKESFCQGGEPDVERIVAVKLIPIDENAEVAPKIEPRPTAESSVERQGASLGMLALGFLGLLGFRRRK